MTNTRWLAENQTQMPWGEWVPALPLPTLFRWRIRDAWEVICGRAEAVCLPTEPPAAFTHSAYRLGAQLADRAARSSEGTARDVNG